MDHDLELTIPNPGNLRNIFLVFRFFYWEAFKKYLETGFFYVSYPGNIEKQDATSSLLVTLTNILSLHENRLCISNNLLAASSSLLCHIILWSLLPGCLIASWQESPRCTFKFDISTFSFVTSRKTAVQRTEHHLLNDILLMSPHNHSSASPQTDPFHPMTILLKS